MTFIGGNIAVSSSDDAINAKDNITINGGQVFAIASENDAIDRNGDITIHGGLVLAYGNDPMGVEQGMDADIGFDVYIKGGTVISMGGTEGFSWGGSGNATTYDIPSFTVEPSSFDVIQIADAGGRTVAVFEVPSGIYNTSSGNTGGWGGGMRFNAVKLLFASESLNKGASYTVSTYAAGTASGSKWQGWYGASGTVSGNATSTTNATAQ
jgi:hypothetical protein